MVLSSELKEMGQEMANRLFGGNLSAYVSHLIVENLKSEFVKENFGDILQNARKMQNSIYAEQSQNAKSAQAK